MLSPDLEQTLERAYKEADRRNHAYATLEHLLLAITEDAQALSLFTACGANVPRLRRNASKFINRPEVSGAVKPGEESMPTACFLRVIERAGFSAEYAGREARTAVDVIVAMFCEYESHGVRLLNEEGVTRSDVMKYRGRRSENMSWEQPSPNLRRSSPCPT